MKLETYGEAAEGRSYSFAQMNLFMFMAQQSWSVVDSLTAQTVHDYILRNVTI